jgi:hypothetical protein
MASDKKTLFGEAAASAKRNLLFVGVCTDTPVDLAGGNQEVIHTKVHNVFMRRWSVFHAPVHSSDFVVVIYCHWSKLSVGQTQRLCNLPSKSYSNNINVPYTGGNDLLKELCFLTLLG